MHDQKNSVRYDRVLSSVRDRRLSQAEFSFLGVLRNAFWNHRKVFLALGAITFAIVYVGIRPIHVKAVGVEIYETPTSTQQSTWTDAAGAHGWTFRAPHNFNLCEVATPVEVFSGSPTGTVYIALHTNANATTTSWSVGSLLATSTGKVLSGNTDQTYIHFPFSNCQFLEGSDHYFLQIQSNQAVVTPNYYVVGYSVGSTTGEFARSFKGTTLQTNSQWGLLINGFDSMDVVEIPTSTISFGGVVFDIDDCSEYASSSFFSSSTIASVGCHIKSALQATAAFLFFPNASSTGVTTFNNSLSSFQDVFPFNIFFDFSAAVSAYSDGYATTSPDFSLTFTAPISKTITISSSTLNTGTFGSVFSFIRSLLVTIIWLFTGLSIVSIITSKPRPKHR